MSVSVMAPELPTCSKCGQKHASDRRCFRFWNDQEFTKEHPPGSVRLAWKRDCDEPQLVKIVTAAHNGRVYIRHDGEQFQVSTGLVIAGTHEENISAEMPVRQTPELRAPRTGYCNAPPIGRWEPSGAEPTVRLLFWWADSEIVGARIDDPRDRYSIDQKTVGFSNLDHARDFCLDRLIRRDSESVFRYVVELHEADPLQKSQESHMPATTSAPRRTKKKAAKKKSSAKGTTTATNGRSLRVDEAHSVNASGITLRIEQIVVVKNDREVFDPDRLEELAASIRRNGILQPLIVCKDAAHADRFRLIAGERRLRAAKLLKLTEVPVTVRTTNSQGIAIARLEENLQREDLNAIEKATAVRDLMQEHGMKQKDVAEILGCTAAQVSNMTGLLELPEIWQQWVAAGRLAATAVRPLRPLAKKRPQVLQQLVDQHASLIDEGNFELTEHHIGSAVEKCTRPIRMAHFSEYSAPTKTECHFKVSAKDDKDDLDIEEITTRWGTKENRAWNVERWDERNAPNLKKRQKKFREAKAEREAKRKPASKASANAKQKVDSFTLQCCIAEQLAPRFAERLSPTKHKQRLPLLLMYMGSTEAGLGIMETLAKRRDATQRWASSIELAGVIAPIADKSAKEQAAWVHGVIVEVLQSGSRNEGLCDLCDLLAAAGIVGVDLLSDWKPNQETLELFPEKVLVSFARDLCGLGPEFDVLTEASIGLIAENWPAGTVPMDFPESMRPAKEPKS